MPVLLPYWVIFLHLIFPADSFTNSFNLISCCSKPFSKKIVHASLQHTEKRLHCVKLSQYCFEIGFLVHSLIQILPLSTSPPPPPLSPPQTWFLLPLLKNANNNSTLEILTSSIIQLSISCNTEVFAYLARNILLIRVYQNNFMIPVFWSYTFFIIYIIHFETLLIPHCKISKMVNHIHIMITLMPFIISLVYSLISMASHATLALQYCYTMSPKNITTMQKCGGMIDG